MFELSVYTQVSCIVTLCVKIYVKFLLKMMKLIFFESSQLQTSILVSFACRMSASRFAYARFRYKPVVA